MAGNGISSVVEVARYRGRLGQIDWVLRRLAGLGVVAFLLLHILDTSTSYFAPSFYVWFVELYKNPIFGLGEILLAGAVVYHAMSGLIIVILDLFPSLWQYRGRAQGIGWLLFVIVFVPIGGVMFFRLVEHNLIR